MCGDPLVEKKSYNGAGQAWHPLVEKKSYNGAGQAWHPLVEKKSYNGAGQAWHPLVEKKSYNFVCGRARSILKPGRYANRPSVIVLDIII